MGFSRQEYWSGLPLPCPYYSANINHSTAAKSLQSCPTLCDPIDGSPPGSAVPGILQARTLEWVVISFSNAWKWKVKVKSLSCVRLLATPWTVAHQAPLSKGFSRQEYLEDMKNWNYSSQFDMENSMLRVQALSILYISLSTVKEKAMATHSSTLAWKIPWMEEPGRLQSMGSRRVRHDWETSLSLFTFMHWRRKWQPIPVFLPGESQGWQSCCLWGRRVGHN